MSSDTESISNGKSYFRPSLGYLLTGWRPKKKGLSSFPFNDSHERKLRKLIFESWKSEKYLTTEQLQIAAYSLAKSHDLKIHPSWEKCGRASDKWVTMFLRRYPNMRGMLMGKQGKPPKRRPESLHSEEDFQSDSSSDTSICDDFNDSNALSSGSEQDEDEPEVASAQRSLVRVDTRSATPSKSDAERDDGEEVSR